MARFRFEMDEDFSDGDGAENHTHVVKTFETIDLDTLLEEFKLFLKNCTFSYVEEVKVVKTIFDKDFDGE